MTFLKNNIAWILVVALGAALWYYYIQNQKNKATIAAINQNPPVIGGLPDTLQEGGLVGTSYN